MSWWAEDIPPLCLLFWAQLNLPGETCPFLGGSETPALQSNPGKGKCQCTPGLPTAHFKGVKQCRELLWGSALASQHLISQQCSCGLMGRDGPAAPLQKARVRGHPCERVQVLYQPCSPAPGFRVLLALGSVLIIKTWKGASEAASAAIQPAPGFQRKEIACLATKASPLWEHAGGLWYSHHLPGEAGIPGNSANSGWNGFFGVWSFAGHSFSFVAVDQRLWERERAEKADGLSKQRSDSLLRRQQTSVVLQWAM